MSFVNHNPTLNTIMNAYSRQNKVGCKLNEADEPELKAKFRIAVGNFITNNSEEAVEKWNECCEDTNRPDDRIYRNDEEDINMVLGEETKPYDAIRLVAGNSEYNLSDDFFSYEVYLKSFPFADSENSPIDISILADYMYQDLGEDEVMTFISEHGNGDENESVSESKAGKFFGCKRPSVMDVTNKAVKPSKLNVKQVIKEGVGKPSKRNLKSGLFDDADIDDMCCKGGCKKGKLVKEDEEDGDDISVADYIAKDAPDSAMQADTNRPEDDSKTDIVYDDGNFDDEGKKIPDGDTRLEEKSGYVIQDTGKGFFEVSTHEDPAIEEPIAVYFAENQVPVPEENSDSAKELMSLDTKSGSEEILSDDEAMTRIIIGLMKLGKLIGLSELAEYADSKNYEAGVYHNMYGKQGIDTFVSLIRKEDGIMNPIIELVKADNAYDMMSGMTEFRDDNFEETKDALLQLGIENKLFFPRKNSSEENSSEENIPEENVPENPSK
jgi:hypothetical protein